MLKDFLIKQNEKFAEEVKKNITTTGRKATGRTQKNITTNSKVTSNFITVETLAPDYLEDLQTGVKPKGDSKKLIATLWPKLTRWAIAKGIEPKDDGVKKSKYTLIQRWTRGKAYFISAFGSSTYRKKGFVDIYSTPLTKIIAILPKDAATAVSSEITTKLKEIK